MFNFRDSHTTLERSKDVATGSTVSAEGLVLVGVLEGGVEKVKPATGAGSEKVVGFSKLDNESLTHDSKVEVVTIPAVSPYTVQLSHGLVAGSGPTSYEARVNASAGVDWPQHATPNAQTFKVSDATAGVLTFNSADAGKTVTVYYRYQLTAVEATQLVPGVRSINNAAAAQLKQVTVMGGHGEVYTKEFDITKDYSTGTLGTLAGGKITLSAGTDLSALGWQVIKLPDASDAHLGLRIQTAL
jgi:hypothetical protein